MSRCWILCVLMCVLAACATPPAVLSGGAFSQAVVTLSEDDVRPVRDSDQIAVRSVERAA